MWRWSDSLANWVRTKMERTLEWMQLEMEMSMRRKRPATGTAGLLRTLVRG